MKQDVFETYLSERYENQIDWYDKKAGRNQSYYRGLQWPLIVLAAITPVLVQLNGVELMVGTTSLKLATLTALVVAVLTTALKTFNYQENWLTYRTTCETLRKEKYFYDAGVGEYGDAADPEALFVERVEALIARENTLWLSAHKPEKKARDKGAEQAKG